MADVEKPDKEMLDNIDLLLNLDLFKEKELDVIRMLHKMKSMGTDVKAKAKEQDDE